MFNHSNLICTYPLKRYKCLRNLTKLFSIDITSITKINKGRKKKKKKRDDDDER